MIRALYSAASGMTAQQLNVDNIANNLANANTAGYKTRKAQFQDLLYQSMVQPGKSAAQLAGQMQLAVFQNPAGLNSIGRSLYLPTDASGDPIVGNPGGQEGIGSLLQGYTEQSNVSVVDEFINLIVAQRGYEANSKVVKAADDMYSQINNLTR